MDYEDLMSNEELTGDYYEDYFIKSKEREER